MATDQTAVRDVIDTFLKRADRSIDDVTHETDLWGEGLGLDSLEAAELSVMLEDAFGVDPFSTAEEMPQTVGDVLSFYEVSSTA